MDFFPIFLDIRNKPCLVVGGGGVAERKTASLLKSGAEVILVTPRLTQHLTEFGVRQWLKQGRLE